MATRVPIKGMCIRNKIVTKRQFNCPKPILHDWKMLRCACSTEFCALCQLCTLPQTLVEKIILKHTNCVKIIGVGISYTCNLYTNSSVFTSKVIINAPYTAVKKLKYYHKKLDKSYKVNISMPPSGHVPYLEYVELFVSR